MSWSMTEQVVNHFNHIHPLTKVDECGEFTCDGCKTYGYGKTYSCASCNFKLHDYCATCPPNLCSFMHPFHELHLVCMRPEQTHQIKLMCNICDEAVEGIYYQCQKCRFNVHPICTQLPEHVKSVYDLDHLLQLSHLGSSKTCMVCHNAIRCWRYRCFLCKKDIHMECVNSFASSIKAAGTQQTGFEWQPQSNHVHQDKAQEPRKSKRGRMFRFARDVTVGVISNLIASPISDSISGKKSTAGGETTAGLGESTTGLGESTAGLGESTAGWTESIADWSESIAGWF